MSEKEKHTTKTKQFISYKVLVQILVLLVYTSLSLLFRSIEINQEAINQNLTNTTNYYDPIIIRTVLFLWMVLILVLSMFNKWVQNQISLFFTPNVAYLLMLIHYNPNEVVPVLDFIIFSIINTTFIKRKSLLLFYSIINIGLYLLMDYYTYDQKQMHLLNLIIISVLFIGLYFYFSQKIEIEKTSQLNHLLFNTIYHLSDNIIFLIDKETLTINDSNSSALNYLKIKDKKIALEKRIAQIIEFKNTSFTWENVLKQKNFDPLMVYELLINKHYTIHAKITFNEIKSFHKCYYVIQIDDISDYVKQQHIIEHNKSLFYEIINNLPHQVYLKDKAGKFIIANQMLCNDYEQNEYEIIGKTDAHFLPYELFEERQSYEKETIENNQSQIVPLQYLYNRGGKVLKTFHSIYSPFFIKELNELGVLVINIDSTELNNAKKTLKESEAKYRLVLENANEGILITNKEGQILDINKTALRILKFNKEFIINKPLQHFMLNNVDFKLFNKNSNELYIEESFLNAEKEVITLELSRKQINNNEYFIIFRDITERKKLEEVLKENEKTFRTLIENSTDVIIITDHEFKINYISPSINNILGYTEEEFKAINFHHLLEEEDINNYKNFLRSLRANIGSKKALDELKMKNKQKDNVYIRIIGQNLTDDNNIQGYIFHLNDITDFKTSEQNLINANFELDSFVYKASHDMKAPLRSVMGLIKLLKLENTQASLEELLQMMDESVVKLDDFIQELTNYVRDQRIAPKVEPINFNEIIKNTLDSLRYIDNFPFINFEIKQHSDTPFYSDKEKVGTILRNIISNAIKYHDLKANPSIKIDIKTNTEYTLITIEDNGPGIDAKYLPKIFDMFYRASEKSFGSGLGLYITRSTLSKIKGEIEVTSILGKGTIFTIYIRQLHQL